MFNWPDACESNRRRNIYLINCRCIFDVNLIFVLFAVEDEDIFQCGKCKRKFSYLSQFLGHKQNQCVMPVQTCDTANSAAAANASVHMAGLTNTNVIYTAQLARAQSSKQMTVMFTFLLCIDSVFRKCQLRLLLITRRRSFAEDWKYFVARFNDVHASGYNSAGSERIWMKFGELRVYCLELALTDFGRDPHRSESGRPC